MMHGITCSIACMAGPGTPGRQAGVGPAVGGPPDRLPPRTGQRHRFAPTQQASCHGARRLARDPRLCVPHVDPGGHCLGRDGRHRRRNVGAPARARARVCRAALRCHSKACGGCWGFQRHNTSQTNRNPPSAYNTAISAGFQLTSDLLERSFLLDHVGIVAGQSQAVRRLFVTRQTGLPACQPAHGPTTSTAFKHTLSFTSNHRRLLLTPSRTAL
jgi:hypothetical protein